METIARYALHFFFYSALGWFFESCYCSIKPRTFLNRGFLTGPLCPIYGTGALMFMIGAGPVRELNINIDINESYYFPVTPFLVFLASLILGDLVEFVVSLLMEKLFNARWWDYSDKFLNIQGRICFTQSLYWGAAGTVFLYLLSPKVVELFNMIPKKGVYIILCVILLIFFVDVADAVRKAMDIHKFMSKLNKFKATVSGFSEKYSGSPAAEKYAQFKEETSKQLAEAKAKFNELSRTVKEKGKKKNRLFNAAPRVKGAAKEQLENIEAKLTELYEKFK